MKFGLAKWSLNPRKMTPFLPDLRSQSKFRESLSGRLSRKVKWCIEWVINSRQVGPRQEGVGRASSASSSVSTCINSSYVVFVVDAVAGLDVDASVDPGNSDSVAVEVSTALRPSEPFILSSPTFTFITTSSYDANQHRRLVWYSSV